MDIKIGSKYGQLTVFKITPFDYGVICECGKKYKCKYDRLTRLSDNGCYRCRWKRKETTFEMLRNRHKVYVTKKIIVKEWSKFDNFLDGIKLNYLKAMMEGWVLKRKDMKLPYSPDNCYWGINSKSNIKIAEIDKLHKRDIADDVIDIDKKIRELVKKYSGVTQKELLTRENVLPRLAKIRKNLVSVDTVDINNKISKVLLPNLLSRLMSNDVNNIDTDIYNLLNKTILSSNHTIYCSMVNNKCEECVLASKNDMCEYYPSTAYKVTMELSKLDSGELMKFVSEYGKLINKLVKLMSISYV